MITICRQHSGVPPLAYCAAALGNRTRLVVCNRAKRGTTAQALGRCRARQQNQAGSVQPAFVLHWHPGPYRHTRSTQAGTARSLGEFWLSGHRTLHFGRNGGILSVAKRE